VEGEAVRVGHCFHSAQVRVAEEVAAFLQQQRSTPGKKNLLEAVVEDHLNERAAEAVLKICACPRKEAAHEICQMKVEESRHRLPMASSVVAVGEVDQGWLSWWLDSLRVTTA
jgi:hypothetical protein